METMAWHNYLRPSGTWFPSTLLSQIEPIAMSTAIHRVPCTASLTSWREHELREQHGGAGRLG
jgi:hypothetical protein